MGQSKPLRRSQEKLKAWKQRSKPLRKVSDKRKDDLREYKRQKRAYLKKHPRCEVHGCRKDGEDIHHKRGRIGRLLSDQRWFMTTCRYHHEKIHRNPGWAREMGYLAEISKWNVYPG